MEESTSGQPEAEKAWAGNLFDLVQFADRGIVSKTLVDYEKANVSLFALQTGQKMSGHSSKWAATIHVLSGAGTIHIGETAYDGKPGALYYMPARTYHALDSTDDLVFLLSLFK
jgi:quercetin dioxygenase-like cupin family protein